MLKTMKVFFLIMLSCVFAAAAAGDAAYAGKKVLIVAGKDRLNDPVISKVKELLINDGVSIRSSGNSELKGAQAGAYDAVFIVNPVKRGTAERSVRIFADENVQKKIVLFNAVGGGYWLGKKDASGKESDESGQIAASLTEKIINVLARGK